jgi:glycosyltransferase involved in cell wall biosynthesis
MTVPRAVALVVPCFNEADRLDTAQFGAFAAGQLDVDLVFVDDGSQDATRELLAELAAKHPGAIKLVALERNGGKAEAVRRGMQAALAAGAALIGYWDADLATPLPALAEFRTLLNARPDLQVVIGARVKLLGRNIERTPGRHVAGRVFATLASLAIDLPVYDTQCGAKVFRNTSALRDVLGEPFAARWAFDVELLARLKRRLGADGVALQDVCCELPLQAWHDVKGSKLRASDLPRALVDLSRVWWRSR